MNGAKMLVPVGGSRGNILQACKLGGVAEIHLLLTRSMFPGTGDSAIELVQSLVELGFETPVRASFIDGPEAGPGGCRDSIHNWAEENSDYIPDRIFVTASTNLIVATLSHLFPSSDLVSLRGTEFLLNGDLISKVDSVDVDSYLAIHGIKLDGEKRLSLNGVKLNAPPLSHYKMVRGKVVLTWGKNIGQSLMNVKKDTQSIGSSIKKIVESVGIGAFGFNAFGFGHLMHNSSDPNIVNTIPDIRHYEEMGILEGNEFDAVSPVHVNPQRGVFEFEKGSTGVVYQDGGLELERDEVYNLRASGKLTSTGQMIMTISNDGREEE